MADLIPESFQGLLLRHRGRTGLTQRELAERVGVSRGSVQDWEAGLKYPDAQHLQALIAVFLEATGLTLGSEATEAQTLWAAARREAPRMQTPFDVVWWAGVLSERAEVTGLDIRPHPRLVAAGMAGSGASERRQDSGEAPDVLEFVGRTAELSTLRTWVLDAGCRLVAVTGIGGIGKTTLTAKLVEGVAPKFHRVYWRSLRNAPPPDAWLAGAVGFLSGHQRVPPSGDAEQVATLLQLLRDQRNLLVLDNFETVLAAGQQESGYRQGFAAYGRLLETVGAGRHQSCLLITSREIPPEQTGLGGMAVRGLQLGGLDAADGENLLAHKQLSGGPEDWARLIAHVGGNGLALKMVGETIRLLFGGDIHAFLRDSISATSFGGIRRLLADQIDRSSAPESSVLRVLAIEREPVPPAELVREVGLRFRRGTAVQAVETLRGRSLVERSDTAGAALTLQSVVLEYVTDRLVEEVADEIARGEPLQLVAQPLIKALAKDYVRNAQERLIGTPILQRLEAVAGSDGAERLLVSLLDTFRSRPPERQGYGPGNVVNLLRLLRGNLHRLDLGHLWLRQVYLAGVEAQDASLAGSQLSDVVLAEAFSFPVCLALNADGSFLAVGTSTGEVWLWRVPDRTPLLALRAHPGAVYGVAVSADGERLASAGDDGTVRLWDSSGVRLLAGDTDDRNARLWSLPNERLGQQIALGITDDNGERLLATLQGHTGAVRGVALTANGRLLASASQDGTARLWDPSSRQVIATFEGHTNGVWGVALDADGRLLASGSQDGMVRLWEAKSGALLASLDGHTGGVWGVALSADGLLLASGGKDGVARVWETSSGALLASLDGHTGGVWGVALGADGQMLATAGQDGTVRLWDTRSGRPLTTLAGHTSGVWGVGLSSDGRLLASGSWDGTVRLWESSTEQLVAVLEGNTSGVRAVAMSADGRLLASGTWDGSVRLWESNTGRLLVTLEGHTSGVWGLALSADGLLLAAGSWDGTARLWDTASGQVLAALEGNSSGARAVALSADGRLLASGSWDGTLRLWDTRSGRLLTTLEGHTSGVWSVALSSDGRLLASGSQDRTVRLWDLRSGRMLAALEGHAIGVRSVALSADGRLLASGSQDRSVRLWDTSNRQLLATLEGHSGGVWGVALSTDGHLLASGSQDGTVRLWETRSTQLLATLEGHSGGVWGVAMSANGRLLASGSHDATVRLWEVPSGVYVRSLASDRRYERLDVTGLTGMTVAQRAALLSLGAVEGQGAAGVDSAPTLAPTIR